MSTIALDNRGGNHTLALWANPSDYAPCPRCGIARKIRTGRANNLCQDCRTVEHHAARAAAEPPAGRMVRLPGGIVRWVTDPELEPPMTAEDWAWCRSQEQPWKRLQAERANRRGYWQRHDRKAS